MSREQLVEMARHEIENLAKNQIDLAPEIYEVPVRSYIDPEQWQLEIDRIFKRLPLALSFTCEVPNPGNYVSLEVMNTPVLITRAEDGVARAFVNMCSHRGAVVQPEGCGEAKGFRCPYHAWAYDLEGRLISVFDAKNFGDFDRSTRGLTPLPTAERAGIIWVTLNPNSNVDIDTFLAGYDTVLEDLGLANAHLVGKQYLQGPNWKVAYDGYRDLYHIPILHRNSFGPDAAYQPDYFVYGPHCRMTSPKNYQKLADKPEDQWTLGELTGAVWTIFPNVSIAGSAETGVMFSMMFPGNAPTESFTTQAFLQPGKTAEHDDPEEIAKKMAFLGMVVRDEDYATGLKLQKALATGAKDRLMFGRNETGGQLFHRWVDALIKTEDKDLPELLATGPKH
jgi:phenylpropionate dioxygenase-like ring-hydroxylating dioxygenase large terminal subunit